MPGTPPRWAAALLLVAWLTAAGPGWAADKTVPPAETTAPAAAPVEDPPAAPQTDAPTPVPPRPAGKPPDRPKTKPRPLKTFRPSEEIHVDKAVDFPADI